MDYLESEIAPDLNRFIKCKIGGKRVKSYYLEDVLSENEYIIFVSSNPPVTFHDVFFNCDKYTGT